jgi:hypothetical protein
MSCEFKVVCAHTYPYNLIDSIAAFSELSNIVPFDHVVECAQVYDELGHELAPYELEYCERWAGNGSSEPAGRKCVDTGVQRTKYSCCGFSFSTG